jgi:hypothetical protein
MPKNIQRLVDLAVQASVDRTDVLATSIVELRHRRRGKDVHRHFDSPDRSQRHNALYGLNILAATSGSADVELGRIGSEESMAKYNELYIEELLADEAAVGTASNILRGEREALAQPYAYVTINPGDVLIFRGGLDPKRGLLPSAHLLKTVGDEPGPRVRELFVPSYNSAEQVSGTRQRLSDSYELAA